MLLCARARPREGKLITLLRGDLRIDVTAGETENAYKKELMRINKASSRRDLSIWCTIFFDTTGIAR